MKSKYKCDVCHKLFNSVSIRLFNDKYMCYNCRRKEKSYKLMESAAKYGRGIIKLEDALKRVYCCPLYVYQDGKGYTCNLSLPICLAEKKFKIVLVEDEEE